MMQKQQYTMRWGLLVVAVCTTLLAMTGCYYHGGAYPMGASADAALPGSAYPGGYYGAANPSYEYYAPYPSYSPYLYYSAFWFIPYGLGWWGGHHGYLYYRYPSYGGWVRSYRTR